METKPLELNNMLQWEAGDLPLAERILSEMGKKGKKWGVEPCHAMKNTINLASLVPWYLHLLTFSVRLGFGSKTG